MNTRVSRHSSQSGFTLVELVISAALMSIILGAAYVCLNAGVASQKLVDSRTDVLQTARVAMAMITADLRAACPLSKDFDFLGMHRTLGDATADNLDFATHNYTPRRPREADFCEVSYFVEKDPRSETLTLWRRRNPTIAPDPLSGGRREEIARGVVGLQFEYYDGLDWYDDWGDEKGKRQNSQIERSNLYGMPEAVRITLSIGSEPKAGKTALTDKDSKEPPLVLQTVVRLNLAAAAEESSASGNSTTSGNQNQNQGQNSATPGGPPR